MELTLVTYGGGEILKNIFNSLAILFGKKSGVVLPLAIIAASFSFIWFVIKIFFSEASHKAFLNYFFPLIAAAFLLGLPKTSVKIEDVLQDKAYKVDELPYIIAKIPQLLSTVGYRLTRAVEKAMHTPNDPHYVSTGMIFGSENALDFRRFVVKNGDLSENLGRFAKQCIAKDIARGHYKLDDLAKEKDIWKFLKDRSSDFFSVRYKNTKGENVVWSIKGCKEAALAMEPYLAKERAYYAKQEFARHLPLTYKSLTGLSESAENLIGQQLMICYLKNELNGLSFAKERAREQQKNTYHVVGALASTALVTMRAVFEALLYASVLFIVPMAFFPGGLKILGSWVWMLMWVQMWPPFYAIVHYVMQIAAQGKASGIFESLGSSERGLSAFTSIGLEELHEQIYALSGYLSALIPFISYAILKGGASSFVHLAGSIMGPTQGAAGAAASEASTGNYSFGNTSLEQTSVANTNAFQKNTAPSITSGFIRYNDGGMTTTHTPSGSYIQENRSHLTTSLSSTDSIVENFQRQEQEMQSFTDNLQKSASESISTSSRRFADFTESLSESQNFSESYSARDASSIQESARALYSAAATLGNQHHISEKDSLEMAVGLSLFKTGANKAYSSLSDEARSDYSSLARNEEFQSHLQKVSDFASSESATALNDQGRRFAEGLSESLDRAYQTQEAHQVALGRLNQLSEQRSWAESHATSIQRSLDQDFVNWATKHYGFIALDSALRENGPAREEMVQEFVSKLVPSCSMSSSSSLSDLYESAVFQSPSRQDGPLDQKREEMESGIGERFEALKGRVSEFNDSSASSISRSESSLGSGFHKEKEEFQEHLGRSSTLRQLGGIGTRIYSDCEGAVKDAGDGVSYLAEISGRYIKPQDAEPPLFFDGKSP